MFAELVAESDIIELINEEPTEGSIRLLLRVKDKRRWGKLMSELLVHTLDEDDYGLAINKSYWADEDSKQVTFCWVLIIWGELEFAAEDLKPLLTRKRKKRPPPSVSQVVTGNPAMSTIVDRRTSTEEGVRRSATVIRLPHRRTTKRNANPGKTKKVTDIHKKGRYAFAEAIGGDAGNPWGT